MPVLTLERDLQCDHPVVDDLGSDDFPIPALLGYLVDRGRGHLRVDVLVHLQ
jgi:hypothetical protein